MSDTDRTQCGSGLGCIVAVTSMLAKKNVNIATMQVYRSAKGEQAVMVVECDQPISEDGIQWLEQVEGVLKVTYFAESGRNVTKVKEVLLFFIEAFLNYKIY